MNIRLQLPSTPVLRPTVVYSGYDPEGDYHGTDGMDVMHGVLDILEVFYGYGGDDLIFGHAGFDAMHGGDGADFLDGGEAEHDIVVYTDSAVGVTVNLASGRGRGGTAEGDVIVNVEEIWGSHHNDRLIGNDGTNRLVGDAGNDRFIGGGGADLLDGRVGLDTAEYSDSSVGVSVDLQRGRGFGGTAEGDTLLGIEDLHGSDHNDTLTGNDEVNYLYGAGGDDLIKGGGGADWLEGVGGDDTLKGGGGADTLIGGLGTNTASYADSPTGVFISLDDNIAAYGDAEGDRLFNIDNLTGSIHADDLWGDRNANALNGKDGNDSLKGYGGADTLAGGAGGDKFIWMSTAETGVTVPTMDLISDFNFAQGDRISLTGVDANALASGNQAFRFIGQAAFTGAPGEINFVHVGNETIIQMQTGVDVDIEGGIRLAGLLTPEASWFLL
jgi:Ca2+-binding RTX toxin-like protein